MSFWLIKKSNICKIFDCGVKCQCDCHNGGADKIRTDHNAQDIAKQSMYHSYEDEKAMEGLSRLFG